MGSVFLRVTEKERSYLFLLDESEISFQEDQKNPSYINSVEGALGSS